MRDQVNELLYDIGLERNDVQVFEDTDLTGQLMYPNFFSAKDFYDEHFDGMIWDPAYTMYNSDTEMVCRLKAMNCLTHMKINVTKAKQKAICIHHLTHDAMRDELKGDLD